MNNGRLPMWYCPKDPARIGIGKNYVIESSIPTATIVIHEKTTVQPLFRIIKQSRVGNGVKFSRTIYTFVDELRAKEKALRMNLDNRYVRVKYIVSKIKQL